MTWLVVTEYLYHKWPLICFVCRNQNQVLSSNMTYHRICSNSTTTGDTCETGNVYSYGAHEFTSAFGGFLLLEHFCVIFGRSWFVPLSFFIWSLCSLSFFDLRLLLTTLLSSSFSNSLLFEVNIKHSTNKQQSINQRKIK